MHYNAIKPKTITPFYWFACFEHVITKTTALKQSYSRLTVLYTILQNHVNNNE